MLIKVNNCRNCPFHTYDDINGSYCDFPANKVEDHELTYEDLEPAPKNCPLQNGKLIIELI